VDTARNVMLDFDNAIPCSPLLPPRAAVVRLRELGRNELSHPDGSFHFHGVAASYTIVAQRIGYAPRERAGARDRGRHRAAGAGAHPVRARGGGDRGHRDRAGARGRRDGTGHHGGGDAELRRRLESSVAATIAHVPGISQRYNGPAAAQPVIRGMGGDRVLVLEDGHRTGDLAATAADHAVAVEPLTARRIEVVRGPAGLLYGSNALGGVINVVREEVPRTLPERFSGTLQPAGRVGEPRGDGRAERRSCRLGRVRAAGELSGRVAGDTRTPLGPLPSTSPRDRAGALGASLDRAVGVRRRGVPRPRARLRRAGRVRGGADPRRTPGGWRSRRGVAPAAGGRPLTVGAGPFSALTLDANVTHYQHDEIEGRIDGRTILGARFDNLSASAELLQPPRPRGRGAAGGGCGGLDAYGRDHRATGAFTGSRSARSPHAGGIRLRGAGGSGTGGCSSVPLRLGAGRTVLAAPIVVGGREVPVPRATSAPSPARWPLLYEVTPGVDAGRISVARAFRTPTIEELYSDGPHLATSPTTSATRSWTGDRPGRSELFVRAALPRLQAEASVFHNALRNYIHHQPTGEIDPRFRRFPVFQARARTRASWGGGRGAVGAAAAAGAGRHRELGRATAPPTGDPLPAIPPLNGAWARRYDARAGSRSRLAGRRGAGPRRRRHPRPAREGRRADPARAAHRRATRCWKPGGPALGARGDRFHTLTLTLDNLTTPSGAITSPASRTSLPSPGRNVRLLYRVHF
jgi:iron complex outermembrane recepter protein